MLVASPLLRDPNFHRTILFLSNHSREDGATAFVLNRPVGKTVELPMPGGLVRAALHYGGPVQPESLIVASLQWRAKNRMVAFRLITDEIGGEWEDGLRVFAGYAGWSPGQLEREISEQSWLVLAPTPDLVEMRSPLTAWERVMRAAPPVFRLMAAAPDDPSRN